MLDNDDLGETIDGVSSSSEKLVSIETEWLLKPAIAVIGPAPFRVVVKPTFLIKNGILIEMDGVGADCCFALTDQWGLIHRHLKKGDARSLIARVTAETHELRHEAVSGTKHTVTGGVLIPRFTNAHTHIGDYAGAGAGFANFLDDAVGVDSIKTRIHTEAASDVTRDMRSYLVDAVSRGTRAVIDFREQGVEGISAARKAAIGLPLRLLLLGRPRRGLEDLEEIVKVSDGLGIPDVSRYTEDELIEIRNVAQKAKKPVVVHSAESVQTSLKCQEIHGASEPLIATEVLKADAVVHMSAASQEEWDVVTAGGAGVIVCPRSNCFYAGVRPPVQALSRSDLSVKLGIGTDNAMQSPSTIFREIEFAARITLVGQGTSLNATNKLGFLARLWTAAWQGERAISIGTASHGGLPSADAKFCSLDASVASGIRDGNPFDAMILSTGHRIHSETSVLEWLTFHVDSSVLTVPAISPGTYAVVHEIVQ